MALIERDPERRPTFEQILKALEQTERAERPRARPHRARSEELLKVPRTTRLLDTGTHKLPFFGRDDQLDQLGAAVLRTASGRPSAVWVRGDSGMGKSALVRHYLRRVERESKALVLRVDVRHLSASESEALAEWLLKHTRPDVDPGLWRLIAKESDGQPFFIQEMIYSLPVGATIEGVTGETWRRSSGSG